MINVEELILDPDFGQTYTVTRSVGTFGPGGFQNRQTQFRIFGVIEPITAKDLEQVPEGDRVIGLMTFYSTVPLYITSVENSGLSDQITWSNEQWRIQQVLEWADFGYWKAFGVRMVGG